MGGQQVAASSFLGDYMGQNLPEFMRLQAGKSVFIHLKYGCITTETKLHYLLWISSQFPGQVMCNCLNEDRPCSGEATKLYFRGQENSYGL